MYSFLYDESETWIVWPKDVRMSRFVEDSSSLVIKQILRQLFDGVRDQLNVLKHELHKEMWQLTTSMNALQEAFDSYLTSTRVDDIFARSNTSSNGFSLFVYK